MSKTKYVQKSWLLVLDGTTLFKKARGRPYKNKTSQSINQYWFNESNVRTHATDKDTRVRFK